MVLQSSGEVEGEFAVNEPLEQARLRRSRSLRHAESLRRTNKRRPKSSTVRSRINSHTAMRRFSELGPQQSFFKSNFDFVNKSSIRRKSSVRKSHSPSNEYSQRKESVELEVVDSWNNQLVSLLIVYFALHFHNSSI